MNYFSNSTQAFYATALKGVYQASGTWPGDAQVVNSTQEAEIRELQMGGKLPQLNEGGVIDMGLQPGYTVGSAAPQQCTPAQGLVALYALKQITEDHVLEAISQIPDPVQQYTARIGYQRATTWERGSPTMQAMTQLLELTDEDLDALFAYAVGVSV